MNYRISLAVAATFAAVFAKPVRAQQDERGWLRGVSTAAKAVRSGDKATQLAALGQLVDLADEAPSPADHRLIDALALGLASPHDEVIAAAATALLAPERRAQGEPYLHVKLQGLRKTLVVAPPPPPVPGLEDLRAELRQLKLPPTPPAPGASKRQWQAYNAAYKAWEKEEATRRRDSEARKAQRQQASEAYEASVAKRRSDAHALMTLAKVLRGQCSDAALDEFVAVLAGQMSAEPLGVAEVVATLATSGRRDAVAACTQVLTEPEAILGPDGAEASRLFASLGDRKGKDAGSENALPGMRARNPGVPDNVLVMRCLRCSMLANLMQATAEQLRQVGDRHDEPAPAAAPGDSQESVQRAWSSWAGRIGPRLRERVAEPR